MSECGFCSSCEDFGFRSRESFDKCSCTLDDKEIIFQFLKWMTSCDLLTCYLTNGELTKDNLPDEREIREKLSGSSEIFILKSLDKRSKLCPVVCQIKEICDIQFGYDKIKEFEYLDVACGTAIFARLLSNELN